MGQAYILTIHPEFVRSYASFGIFHQALASQKVAIEVINLRDYAKTSYASVDDRPYGGGDGMVMRPDCLADCVNAIEPDKKSRTVIYTSPKGKTWNQAGALELSLKLTSEIPKNQKIIFVCGRFGGVDQRFIDLYVDTEYSCGDFVLGGGELPVMMMLESALRLIPDVVGNHESIENDSFSRAFDCKIEYPLYTRPLEFEGLRVPDVLTSGDHAKISAWKKANLSERKRYEEK